MTADDRAVRAQRVLAKAVEPALALLPKLMDVLPARVLILAIGFQESQLLERVQRVSGGGKGPARGLWQNECGGGVRGVLGHPVTRQFAERVCATRRVEPVASLVWSELEHDDILAAAFARLILYADPSPLPEIGMVESAWLYYLRTWRPGKPHPDQWAENYRLAVQALTH
jgi:hypothetical protein